VLRPESSLDNREAC